jgi:hypothetical protein
VTRQRAAAERCDPEPGEAFEMRTLTAFVLCAGLVAAGSAQAAIKFYNGSANNGTPGDSIVAATNLCPPAQTTVGDLENFVELLDDNTGTVTLQSLEHPANTVINLGPDQLTMTFGPGAFVFINNLSTTSLSGPHVSNTTGIGAHGPSGTDPGESTEWGIVSGWQITGGRFCVSSPPGICDENGFAHGQTDIAIIESPTYDLGTWNFDAEGDYEAEQFYVFRTSNGGLSNNQRRWRGAFQGASLPALPLVGFGALALGLAVIGGRALTGRK